MRKDVNKILCLLCHTICSTSFIVDERLIFAVHHNCYLTSSGTIVYNAYMDGLLKRRDSQQALAIFQRMKRENCEPTAETYTMVINLYGKVNHNEFVHSSHFIMFRSYYNFSCGNFNLLCWYSEAIYDSQDSPLILVVVIWKLWNLMLKLIVLGCGMCWLAILDALYNIFANNLPGNSMDFGFELNLFFWSFYLLVFAGK